MKGADGFATYLIKNLSGTVPTEYSSSRAHTYADRFLD